MSRRILITGATGYIGSHTIVELLNAGYEVIGVDNFSNSNKNVLKGIEKISGKSIDFMEVDCANMEAFSKVFENYPDIEGVIHFAASKAVGESVAKPLIYFNNNLKSLLNLIGLMMERGKAANIVFSSSCTVYGQPSREDLPISEDAPLQPATSPYGRTKQMAEDILGDCVKAYPKLNVTLLRYFNPIGAHPTAYIGELPNGVPQNLIPFITQTAAGIRDCLNVFGDDYNTPDGSCIRDYIYVVDLAKAHVKAIDRLLQKGERLEIFNLGTGKGLSVLELINAFIEATGVKLNYKIVGRRAGDVEQVWANPAKANSVLGWRSDTPIGEVLASAWKWQQQLLK
jgi:UDP-glucose 4-epimerase